MTQAQDVNLFCYVKKSPPICAISHALCGNYSRTKSTKLLLFWPVLVTVITT
jgi:hypothetical protein